MWIFAQNIGIATAFVAEFYALLLAVELAFQKGWRRVWFEVDYMVALHTFFNKNFSPPWQLRRCWERCNMLMESMEVRHSHIFREGNVPADTLSNVALRYSDLQWWDSIIPEILGSVGDDFLGKSKFRFC